jgi:hypothetical protein
MSLLYKLYHMDIALTQKTLEEIFIIVVHHISIF